MRKDFVGPDNQEKTMWTLAKLKLKLTGVGVIKTVYIEKNITPHLNKRYLLLSTLFLSLDVYIIE